MINKYLTPQNFFPSLPVCLQRHFAEKNFIELLNDLPSILETLFHLCSSRMNEIPEGVHLQNPDMIYIEKGVSLETGIVIKGPCYLSKGAKILQGAYIRENTYIGPSVHVGHASEVKNSFLLPHSSLPHFNYVGDSFIGPKANLGAGVKVANLRLDRKAIRWDPLDTDGPSRVKLGAIIGHSVQVGCNSVINPGAILFPLSIVPPLSSISGLYGEPVSC